LVKGWKGSSWSFPRGKKSKDEEDHACAIREVSINSVVSCLFCVSFILHFCSKIDISNNRHSLIIVHINKEHYVIRRRPLIGLD
jgi:predicted NUDIX family NTP pyrophosphohydrolase